MMNRRSLLKHGGLTVAILAVSPMALLSGCGDTKQLAKWTGILIASLKDVSPILANMGAGQIVALVSKALPIAESLKKAFEANDHVSTLQFLDNLINPATGIIVEIANSVGLLANDAQKRIVLGVLALGMVALRLIAANISDEVPASGVAEARTRSPRAVESVEKAAKAGAIEATFAAVRF